MSSLTIVLLWCVVQITLFSAVAGALYLLVRHFTSGVSSVLLTSSLLLVIVLTALVASPWPRWQWPNSGLETASNSAPSNATDETMKAGSSKASVTGPNGISPYAAAWQAFSQSLTSPVATIEQNKSSYIPSFIGLIWTLFAICLVISAARLAWGVRQVNVLLRRSTPLNDRRVTDLVEELRGILPAKVAVAIRESTEIVTPAAIGWHQQHILLPSTWNAWTDDEIRVVLAHELAHVASRDYRSWFVARLAIAIHFYHPIVRWLASRLQLEQELAADAAAAHLVGDRQQYLQCLARLALATPHHHFTGPAKTLIPSRSLLLRRVEMLRSKSTFRSDSVAGKRFGGISVGLLIIVALAVSGIRQPEASIAQETTVAPNTIVNSKPIERIPLTVVPKDAAFFMAIRPADVFADGAFVDLLKEADEHPLLTSWDISAADLAEVLVIAPIDPGTPPRRVMRFVSPEKLQAALVAIMQRPGIELSTLPGNIKAWRDDREQVTQLDAVTLVFDNHPGEGKVPSFDNPAGPWLKQWKEVASGPLCGVVNVQALRALLSDDQHARLIEQSPMGVFGPILEQVQWAVAGVGLENKLTLEAVAQCDSEEHAQQIANAVQALLMLGGGVVEQQQAAALRGMKEGTKPEEFALNRELIESIFAVAKRFTSTAKPAAEKNQVRLIYSDDELGKEDAALITQMLLPAVMASRAAAYKMQGMNNLKQLALAMHNYAASHGHFPPAMLYKDGSPHLYSWRVALLPYLEQQALYDAYHFDEPWDSSSNKKIADTVVDVFRSPCDDPASTNASYFVLTGPDTVFNGREGTTLQQITDGLSMTLLIVEAKRDIPWTKPEDIPYAVDKPLPELGGWMPGILVYAYCDGAASSVSQDVDESMIRRLITKAGGEEVLQQP